MSAAPQAPDTLETVPRRRIFPRVLRLAFGASVAALALAAPACTISPQPVPPPDEADPPFIQTALIHVKDDGAGGVIVRGEPGAVAPAADVIRTLNRVSPAPATEASVLADGSFEVVLPGLATDSFRLQARKDTVYSIPVDVQGTDAGPVVDVAPPFGGCVAVEPAQEVVFGPTPAGGIEMQPLRVVNNCPFDISVMSLSSVSGNAAFEPMAGTTSPGYIAIGGDGLLGVAFRPAQAGLYEDNLMLQFSAMPPDPAPDPALLPIWILSVRGLATEP